MGGSGIAGDVLSVVAGPFVPVPITVSKDYELPGFVGERTLVFALSFSGNSEEIVEGVTEAAALGAHVVMVCEGGELAPAGGGLGSTGAADPARHPDAACGPRRARGPAPPRARAHRAVPRRTRVGAGRDRAARASTRSARGRGQPRRARWRVASDARCRSSTAPVPSAAWPRCGGSTTSTRTPRHPRSTTGCPSCATTRSRGGASTAT